MAGPADESPVLVGGAHKPGALTRAAARSPLGVRIGARVVRFRSTTLSPSHGVRPCAIPGGPPRSAHAHRSASFGETRPRA